MRLAALLALGFAAAVTVGCSSGRYVANSSATSAARGPSYNTGTASVRSMPAPRVVRRTATTSAPARPVTYASRTHLASPPPPPPPALHSYKTASTPVRSASTVRAPGRSLPARPTYRAAPANAPAPGNVVLAPAPFAAPAAPAYVAPRPAAPVPRYAPRAARPTRQATPRRRRIAPLRRNNCPPVSGFGSTSCPGGG